MQKINNNDAVREQTENDLNSKILKITMKIREHYPELSKYLEEMPMTVQPENHPEITPDHLKTYYESLISLLDKYKADDCRGSVKPNKNRISKINLP